MRSLLAIPDGGLWIGYTNGGARSLNRGRVYNYGESDGMPTGGVRGFAEDADGTVIAKIAYPFGSSGNAIWAVAVEDWLGSMGIAGGSSTRTGIPGIC